MGDDGHSLLHEGMPSSAQLPYASAARLMAPPRARGDGTVAAVVAAAGDDDVGVAEAGDREAPDMVVAPASCTHLVAFVVWKWPVAFMRALT